MNKLKKYSFYIGIVGAVLSVVGFILDFFGAINILPIIIDIVAVISAMLISLGIIEKEDKTSTTLKEDIKADIIEKVDYPNTLKKDAEKDKNKIE
jgi:uncharacterized membrane protein